MVHADRQAARGSMGVCLQENVIYESLTVEDHLQVAARLRRIPSDQRDNEVFCFNIPRECIIYPLGISPGFGNISLEIIKLEKTFKIT